MPLGMPELILVLLIVVVLFGVGRVGRIGGELGQAIANFRKSVKTSDAVKEEEPSL